MCVAVSSLVACVACSASDTPVAPSSPSSVSPSRRTGPETEVTPEKPTASDSSITMVANAVYCNPDGGSQELLPKGEPGGPLGDIRVHKGNDTTQILWDKPVYIVVVNDSLWGYVNKAHGPEPATSKLINEKWGGAIFSLKVCGKK